MCLFLFDLILGIVQYNCISRENNLKIEFCWNQIFELEVGDFLITHLIVNFHVFVNLRPLALPFFQILTPSPNVTG